MKKVLFLMLLFVISINYVYADDYNITFNSDDVIDKMLSVDIVVNDIVDSDKLFYGLTGIIEYDDNNLELTSIKGKNDFNLTYNDKLHKIVLYNLSGIDKKTVILTMEFDNKNNISDGSTIIKLKDIKVSDLKSDISLDDVSKEIKYNSSIDNSDTTIKDNTYLKEITINGKKINFNKDTLNYEIVVSNDTKKITIDAISEEDNTKIDGIGEYNLDIGNNEFDIVVTSPSGSRRTYTININRETSDSNGDDSDLFITSSDNKRNNTILYIGGGLVLFSGIIFLIIRNWFIKNKKEGEKNEKNSKKNN